MERGPRRNAAIKSAEWLVNSLRESEDYGECVAEFVAVAQTMGFEFDLGMNQDQITIYTGYVEGDDGMKEAAA
jgi:hypothetical protein